MTSIADLRVHLRGPNKEPFKGRCTALEASETELCATVEFQGSPVPAIGLGTTASLSFRGGGLVANIDIEGIAIARNDEQVGRSYSFTLSGVPRDMLLALANRRNVSRVRSRGAQGARAVLLRPDTGTQATAEVHDISTDGLSVIVRPALESDLAGTMEVVLGLTLPASPPTMYLRVFIRNRRLCGNVVLYGLQFDRSTAGFAAVQERIASYMRGGAAA